MARQRRIVIPGLPYHVVQRASHQAFILDDDHDKAVLVRIMVDWQSKTLVKIAAFVIMGNHFHLVIESPTEEALSEFMAGVCGDYSRYYNLKISRHGPNWQGRFYAAPMDGEHTVATIRYIERNPVAAEMVVDAWLWHWSSAAYHAGEGPKPALINSDLRPASVKSAEWKEQLRGELDPELRNRIMRATRSGRALGAPEWAAKLDQAMGMPLPRGPKPVIVKCP